MLKALAILASAVSVFFAACMVFPAPNMTLLPLTVATPELAHWFFLFDLAVAVFGFICFRPAAYCALVSALIAAWPLVLTAKTLQPFRIIDTGSIAAETLPLNMLCYRAAGAGLHPAIIDIYGGAWQRGTPRSDEQFNRYMAARGYTVFAIDYRHAPAFQYPAQIEDVRAAIAFIHSHAAEYGADANRLVLCGRSAGGQLALLAAYEPGALPVRGVISFYGPSDLANGYRHPPSPDPIDNPAMLRTYIGGGPDQLPDLFRAASPFTFANLKQPPTLLIQGSRDHIVKAQFARNLEATLLAAGNRVELLEIPWAEHAFDAVFSGLGNQLALRKIGQFLRSVLEPMPQN